MVPRDLRAIPRWILWRWVRRGDRLDKCPTRPSADGNCDPHDPGSWLTFEDAVDRLRIARVNNTWGSGGGVGLAMSDEDDLGCVDLDGCRDPETGKLAGWAREIVEQFDSFTETSPSGTGVHIFARGAPDYFKPNSIPQKSAPVVPGKDPLAEVFVAGQFITVTGRHVAGTPREVRSVPDAWAWLASRLGASTQRPVRPVGGGDVEAPLALVASALNAFTSDHLDRGRWVMIGRLLKARFGEDARETYLTWLARSPNDDPEMSAALWDSFEDEPDAMTLRSIFWIARQHGWRPPTRLLFTEDDDEPDLYFTEEDDDD